MPLVDPRGRPIGNPVVAHIVAIQPRPTIEQTQDDIARLCTFWQRTLGVPAIVVVPPVRVVGAVRNDGQLDALPDLPGQPAGMIGHVLSDGQLVPALLDADLAAKVAEVLAAEWQVPDIIPTDDA